MSAYYGKYRNTYILKDAPIAGGSGGEGSVYEIEGKPDLVAKLYHDKKFATPLPNGGDSRQYLYEKLLTMLEQPVNPYVGSGASQVLTVAWPQDILMDFDGTFVGYTMPRVNSCYHIYAASRERERKQLYPNYTWKTAVIIAYNLALAVKTVHSTNAVIGDFNTNNIMLDNLGHVTLIDTDSFNITNQRTGKVYKCTVGVAENLPPELQGKNLAVPNSIFTKQTDNFALAIHIFSLLMNNCHPFSCNSMGQLQSSASGNPAARNIVQGNCPYVSNGRGTPAIDAPDITMLPPELQQLFERTFSYDVYTAVRAATIARRPSADEWFNALHRLVKTKFAVCGNPSHVYPPHNRMCPWCAVEQKKRGQITINQNLIPQQPQPHPPIQKPVSQKSSPSVWQPSTTQSTVPDTFHFDLAEGTDGWYIQSYSGILPRNLTIPAVIDGKKVTGIGDRVFMHSGSSNRLIGRESGKALCNVTIEVGIQYIGAYTFENCEGLQTISLPGTLKTIGYQAFGHCKSLSSVRLSNGLIEIKDGAFEYCPNLTSISLPGSVVTIGGGAFMGCEKLKSVGFSYGLETIESSAFRDCPQLTEVILPGSVKTIGMCAFCGDSSLKKLRLNEGLLSIGDEAFVCCSLLRDVILPKSLTNIGTDPFHIYQKGSFGQKKLTEVSLRDGLRRFLKDPTVTRRGPYRRNEKLTIYCHEGTCGAMYAKQAGYRTKKPAKAPVYLH